MCRALGRAVTTEMIPPADSPAAFGGATPQGRSWFGQASAAVVFMPPLPWLDHGHSRLIPPLLWPGLPSGCWNFQSPGARTLCALDDSRLSRVGKNTTPIRSDSRQIIQIVRARKMYGRGYPFSVGIGLYACNRYDSGCAGLARSFSTTMPPNFRQAQGE